jgi:hypothetical protein
LRPGGDATYQLVINLSPGRRSQLLLTCLPLSLTPPQGGVFFLSPGPPSASCPKRPELLSSSGRPRRGVTGRHAWPLFPKRRRRAFS